MKINQKACRFFAYLLFLLLVLLLFFVGAVVVIVVYCGAGAAWAALLFSVRQIYIMLGFFRLPLIATISEF
ncbi:MAG: hypothetical protein V4563_06185 [Pseudomonadota bacterium]